MTSGGRDGADEQDDRPGPSAGSRSAARQRHGETTGDPGVVDDEGGVGPNGPAVGWGKLFVTKGHYEIAALNLSSGEEMWSTQMSDKSNVGIDIQLIAYDNKVYVSTVPGTSNADFYAGGGYGVIQALHQKTGATVWQFNTVDSPDIWGNPTVNSGGGSWFPPAIDTNTGITYWGTGNPGPIPGTKEFPGGSSRPGPNLYTDSMLALNSRTGKLLWYKQVKPHDLFDLDFQSSPILATAMISGKETEIGDVAGAHLTIDHFLARGRKIGHGGP